MNEIWFHWFAAVCGQNPEHTWAPGGIPLPFCERCTGLYVGMLVAVVLQLVLRPRLTGRFLWVHGGLLLVMAPFGFHWVAHGPWLRSMTGVLFGFGVATFLWAGVTPARKWLPRASSGVSCSYGVALVLVTIAVPMLGAWGGSWAAGWLAGLGLLGLLAAGWLILVSAWAGACALMQPIASYLFGPGLLRAPEPSRHGKAACRPPPDQRADLEVRLPSQFAGRDHA